MVDKRAYVQSRPRRGDVVLFEVPGTETTYVKRILATPGDHVSYRNGNLLVNDEEAGTTRHPSADLTVRPGHYFLVGDNLDHSRDSRQFGEVHLQGILGRALFIYFSLEPGNWGIRRDRIGKKLE